MFFNGFTQKEMANSYGVNKLGVEHLNPFFTGGVLFDIQSIKGRRMNKGEEIKVEDLQRHLKPKYERIGYQAG